MPRGGRGDGRGPIAVLSARSIAVIGDCTLDVTVVGALPLRPGGDVPAAITLGPGGQAANVAVRLARRGRVVRLVSPVGEDAAGRLLRELMTAEGVQLVALPAARSALVVAMLDPDGERAMASSRVSLETHAAGSALADAVRAGVAWVHCSGYALLDEATGDDLARALAILPSALRRSVAGGSLPAEPDRVARFRRSLELIRPQLLVVNRDEASALLGDDATHAGEAAGRLASLADVVVVTAAAAGSAASLAGEIVTEPAAAGTAGDALDATGAGDAFTAVLVGELESAGWPPPSSALRDALRVASQLGSRVASAVGAQARVEGEEEGVGEGPP